MPHTRERQKQKSTEAFRKILVATDFTARGHLAVQRAIRLPLAKGASIILAHVLPPNIPSKYKAAIEKQARGSLHRLAYRIARKHQKAANVTVVPLLLEGISYDEIVRLAHSEKAELIVIGRHGQRIIRDLVLGSTAEKIIRKANLPVLIVNRKVSAPYVRPIIAVELADTPRSAIGLTLCVVGPNAAITLVHALNVPFERYIGDAQLDAYRRECQDRASSKISAALNAFADEIQSNVVVKRGDARSVLVKEIDERAADLIVLGTHGGNGFSRALLGSVTEYVVRSVECDALVCPGHN